MALAVPADVVRSVANDIRKDGKVLRGWIGIMIAEKDGRLEIREVEPESPAEAAKLKPGDVIVKAAGAEIPSGAAFSQEIRKRKPGTEVVLEILRDKESKEVKVKLGDSPPRTAASSWKPGFRGCSLRLSREPNGRPAPGGPERFFVWENRRYIGGHSPRADP